MGKGSLSGKLGRRKKLHEVDADKDLNFFHAKHL
jgi:hypothetical protein